MTHAYSHYPTLSVPQLLERLTDVTAELTEVHIELAYTRAKELNERVQQWLQSRETSVTGRIEDARYAAATETTAILELDGRLHALTEEKYLILKLLDYADA